jgi:hypothetical protein
LFEVAAEFKEQMMMNDLPFQTGSEEAERNSLNAAFYELGFRWHWDIDTYNALMVQRSSTAERIRHYLETWQPHLLKAYDAEFLVELIQEKKARLGSQRVLTGTAARRHFDWSESLGAELGA